MNVAEGIISVRFASGEILCSSEPAFLGWRIVSKALVPPQRLCQAQMLGGDP
jgi:hypothetical protein